MKSEKLPIAAICSLDEGKRTSFLLNFLEISAKILQVKKLLSLARFHKILIEHNHSSKSSC